VRLIHSVLVGFFYLFVAPGWGSFARVAAEGGPGLRAEEPGGLR